MLMLLVGNCVQGCIQGCRQSLLQEGCVLEVEKDVYILPTPHPCMGKWLILPTPHPCMGKWLVFSKVIMYVSKTIHKIYLMKVIRRINEFVLMTGRLYTRVYFY